LNYFEWKPAGGAGRPINQNMKPVNPRKAIFLDRDGTLIEEVNFLCRIEDLRFFSYTDEAVSLLKQQGYLLIVITNQSGVARGIFEESAVHAIHEKIQEDLSEKLDAFFYCPHMPDAGCDCRKPGLGMINSACERFEIDLAGSWMIGDKSLDIMTGVNAGIKTVLVKTGYGKAHGKALDRDPDLVAETLLDAARFIIQQQPEQSQPQPEDGQ
jgi:D-glycero-D-manno-heptose 1,7-bisphosphate phosphatase